MFGNHRRNIYIKTIHFAKDNGIIMMTFLSQFNSKKALRMNSKYIFSGKKEKNHCVFTDTIETNGMNINDIGM